MSTVNSDAEKAFVLWFTGLSGAGKSTSADLVFEHLRSLGLAAERLDGDSIRSLFPATGFSRQERNDHVKRVGFLASRLERHGVIVVASFVSPYREAREFVRAQCENYFEIFVSTSLEVCEKRDPKGLYKKARRGEIQNFTGVNDPYEAPTRPELSIDTQVTPVEKTLELIREFLNEQGFRV